VNSLDHQCSAKSGEPFKFANEKGGDGGGEATELPNPLRTREPN
jgi:hypothetical protein